MANFKVIVKKESFLELTVTAKDKLDAGILAKHKAKNREGWIDDIYNIVNIESV
jgi:hypothetical protein